MMEKNHLTSYHLSREKIIKITQPNPKPHSPIQCFSSQNPTSLRFVAAPTSYAYEFGPSEPLKRSLKPWNLSSPHATFMPKSPSSEAAPSPRTSLQCSTTSPNASKMTSSPPLSPMPGPWKSLHSSSLATTQRWWGWSCARRCGGWVVVVVSTQRCIWEVMVCTRDDWAWTWVVASLLH